jgi:hypothetical protein
LLGLGMLVILVSPRVLAQRLALILPAQDRF